MGKKKWRWTAIGLFAIGAAIMGMIGVNELSRWIVTPIWTFGVMALAYATMRDTKSDTKS